MSSRRVKTPARCSIRTTLSGSLNSFNPTMPSYGISSSWLDHADLGTISPSSANAIRCRSDARRSTFTASQGFIIFDRRLHRPKRLDQLPAVIDVRLLLPLLPERGDVPLGLGDGALDGEVEAGDGHRVHLPGRIDHRVRGVQGLLQGIPD